MTGSQWPIYSTSISLALPSLFLICGPELMQLEWVGKKAFQFLLCQVIKYCIIYCGEDTLSGFHFSVMVE